MADGEYSEHRDVPLRAIVRRLQKNLKALALRLREAEQLASGSALHGPLGRIQSAVIALAARMSKVEAALARLQAQQKLDGTVTEPPPVGAPDVYEQDDGGYDLQRRLSASQERLAAYDKSPPQQTQPMAKERPADPAIEPEVFAKPSSDSKKTLVSPRKKAEGDE